MALKLDQTLPDGRVVNFHKVMSVDVDALTGEGTATLGSWPQYEDFVLRTAPALRRKYSFSWGRSNAYEDAYNAIKLKEEFSGAVDF